MIWDIFFVVRSNDSFNFPPGLIKYIVIVKFSLSLSLSRSLSLKKQHNNNNKKQQQKNEKTNILQGAQEMCKSIGDRP